MFGPDALSSTWLSLENGLFIRFTFHAAPAMSLRDAGFLDIRCTFELHVSFPDDLVVDLQCFNYECSLQILEVRCNVCGVSNQ